jgi:class 3 adenylate cyclase
MGLHTGEPTLGEEGYLGLDVVRGARIASAAHGGQVLVSETTRALLPADLPGARRSSISVSTRSRAWSGPSTCSK